TTNLDLSGAGEPPQDVPFVLQPSPGGPINFVVNCRLRIEAEKGSPISPDMVAPSRPRRPIEWTATLTEQMGDVVLGHADEAIVPRLAGQAISAARRASTAR